VGLPAGQRLLSWAANDAAHQNKAEAHMRVRQSSALQFAATALEQDPPEKLRGLSETQNGRERFVLDDEKGYESI
jgi:hypothetical protein